MCSIMSIGLVFAALVGGVALTAIVLMVIYAVWIG